MTMRLNLCATVAECIQLTYRTPAKTVENLLPEGLELVQRGPWAFWGVQARRIEQLRPSVLPAIAGVGYMHVAYRLKVQAMNHRAEIVRGWYDVAVLAESGFAGGLGSRLFGVLATAGKVALKASDCGVCVEAGGGSDVFIDAVHTPARLIAGSCFPTVEDARSFSRDTTDGLSVVGKDQKRQLRISRQDRSGPIIETPLAIREARLGYFDEIDQARHVELEWASRLGASDFSWNIVESVTLLQQQILKPNMQATG